MIKFNLRYFIPAATLLAVEITIALWVKDRWIRPFGGDFLVVILIYCTVKAFLAVPYSYASLGALLFSFAVETLQYFHFVERIGLGDHAFACTVIGTGFHWGDMACYTGGIALVLAVERFVLRPHTPTDAKVVKSVGAFLDGPALYETKLEQRRGRPRRTPRG